MCATAPLQALRSRAAWGQEQFQLLLQSRTSSQTEASQEALEDLEDLEDLRYRWMLHKSKLKDVTQVRKRTKAKVREGDGFPLELVGRPAGLVELWWSGGTLDYLDTHQTTRSETGGGGYGLWAALFPCLVNGHVCVVVLTTFLCCDVYRLVLHFNLQNDLM